MVSLLEESSRDPWYTTKAGVQNISAVARKSEVMRCKSFARLDISRMVPESDSRRKKVAQ